MSVIIINNKINIKNLLNNTIIVIIVIWYSYFITTSRTVSFGVGNITVNLLFFMIFFLLIVNSKKIINNNKLAIILFIIDIVFLIISNISNGGGYGSIISVVTFLLIILVSLSIKISNKIVCFCFIIFLLFWIYALQINYIIYDVNTNNAASSVFYLCLLLINCLWLLLSNKHLKKISIIAIICITFLNVMKYDSRNIMLMLFLLFVLIFFDISNFFNKKSGFKKNMFWFLITIGSLLITIIYILMYYKGYSLNFSFISVKKFYTGREIIWKSLYNAFENNLLFGIGSKSYYFPHQGAHNYMLSVLILFGIPHFIVFISIIYNYIKNIFDRGINKNNYLCLISLLCLFLTEFFEASFIGGQKLATLFLLSIIMLNANDISGDSNEKN